MRNGTSTPISTEERVARDRARAGLFGKQSVTRVGRFVLVETIGQGGMGAVYLARDPDLDRDVAIKVLRADLSGDEARARLAREAKTLARVAHPNVVAVHEVGEHDGQLFIAMELVVGTTLREWVCRGGHSIPEILKTFAQAGAGLAAAHAAGLVHRDFKPDNVICGDDGRVRVLDFGLARESGLSQATPADTSIDPTRPVDRITTTGSILGTPAYMALEQFDGLPADARTDQFAFCVALFEALYGEPPFPRQNLGRLHDAVTQGRTSVPSGTKVPARLGPVILRGLRPIAHERWPSMPELLEALTHDPSVARRRRARLIGAGAVGSVAAGVVAWFVAPAMRRPCQDAEAHIEAVWGSPDRQTLGAAFAAVDSPFAAETWSRLEPELDDYAAAWASASRVNCEATRISGTQSAALMDRRAACLQRGRSALRALVQSLHAGLSPDTAARALAAAEALPPAAACEDAQRLLAEVEPPPPDVAAEVERTRAAIDDAAALQRAGRFADAVTEARSAAEMAEPTAYAPVNAEAALVLGEALGQQGEFEAGAQHSETAYRTAIACGHDSIAAAAAAHLVKVHAQDLGDPSTAERWAEDAKVWVDRLDDDEARVALLLARGTLHHGRGRLKAARADLEAALDLRRSLSGETDLRYATGLHNLAVLAFAEGDFPESARLHKEALRIRSTRLGENHPDLAGSLTHLATTHFSMGDLDEARRLTELGLELRHASLGDTHPSVAESLNNLGVIELRAGAIAKAETHLRGALELYEAVHGPHHPKVLDPRSNLAVIAQLRGDLEGAIAQFEQVRRSNIEVHGLAAIETAKATSNLADAVAATGDHARALGLFEEARHGLLAALGADHPDLAPVTSSLAFSLVAEGRAEEAVAHQRKAVALLVAATSETNPVLAVPLTGLAEALIETGEVAEALRVGRRAAALWQDPGAPQAQRTQFAIARALHATDPARAKTVAKRALAALPNTAEAERAPIEAWLRSH